MNSKEEILEEIKKIKIQTKTMNNYERFIIEGCELPRLYTALGKLVAEEMEIDHD